ncbi:MAG: response regulator [Chloroflexota bacterium]
MTVLIVDDDPVSRRLIRMTLERNKQSVAEVGNAEAAIEWLKADASATLLIMDLDLPGRMKGLQFFGFLHTNPRWRNLPVIVCTGDASEKTVHDAISRGVRHYLVKPVKPALLMEKVNEINSRAVPVLEPRYDAIARLDLSEIEYKYLVEDAEARMGQLADALAAAREREDLVESITIVRRFREPAALLGADRVVAAVDELLSLLEDAVSAQQRDQAFGLVSQEVEILREALRQLSRMGQSASTRTS